MVSKYNKINLRVGTGKPISINKVVKLLNAKRKYIFLKKGEPFQTNANIKKIKKDFKWFPKISFKDGLDKMTKDISLWKNAPLWSKSKIKTATKKWFKYVK